MDIENDEELQQAINASFENNLNNNFTKKKVISKTTRTKLLHKKNKMLNNNNKGLLDSDSEDSDSNDESNINEIKTNISDNESDENDSDGNESDGITRTITDSEVDQVRVILDFPTLQKQTSKGDIKGSSVRLKIRVKYNNQTEFTTIIDDTVKGRTADLYQRSYLLNLEGTFPVDINVLRIPEM